MHTLPLNTFNGNYYVMKVVPHNICRVTALGFPNNFVFFKIFSISTVIFLLLLGVSSKAAVEIEMVPTLQNLISYDRPLDW